VMGGKLQRLLLHDAAALHFRTLIATPVLL
jgi:hypothetical protein